MDNKPFFNEKVEDKHAGSIVGAIIGDIDSISEVIAKENGVMAICFVNGEVGKGKVKGNIGGFCD